MYEGINIHQPFLADKKNGYTSNFHIQKSILYLTSPIYMKEKNST